MLSKGSQTLVYLTMQFLGRSTVLGQVNIENKINDGGEY